MAREAMQQTIGELAMMMIDKLDEELDIDTAQLEAAMILVAVAPDPVERPGFVQYRHFGTMHAFHENIGLLNAVQMGIMGKAAGGPGEP